MTYRRANLLSGRRAWFSTDERTRILIRPWWLSAKNGKTIWRKQWEGGANALAAYLRDKLGLRSKNLQEVPPLPRQLAIEEAFQPPVELEKELHDVWSTLVHSGAASQPAFWTTCHIRWLEQGRFGNDPNAAFSTGVAGKREPNLDTRTRDLLRHLGGLPHIRGNVSVFSDCPLSRAWWRRRLAVEAIEHAPAGRLTVNSAHRALHRSNQVWETLVMLSLRRVTAINQPTVRAAIVTYMASQDRVQPNDIVAIAQGCARYGLGYSLQHISWDDLFEVVQGSAL